jgi:hypothetical protein
MPGKRVRMLFIGNSFTTKNNLPTLLSGIALAGMGINIESKVISAGGASLRRHWNAGAASAITGEKWDHVVFQEQSTLPVKNSNRFHENVREFVPVMRESGAKMVLFMTWARKKEPENQTLLTDSYNQIGKELQASVVPVGTAWQKLLAKHDKPVLHAEDGSHPTVAGSYLAACTFYATLFGGDPTKIETDFGDLTDEERKLLQRIAMAACV